jgi:CheY-like chemotaxis protein
MKKVVIVEDDPIIQYLHKIFVERMGHQVVGCFDKAPDVIEFLRQNEADLVLMDIRLDSSEKDGIQVMREVKQFSQVPVIYVSGYLDKESYTRALDTEMMGVFSKPVEQFQLESVIGSLQELTDSMRYARQIQDSIFPKREDIDRVFPHHLSVYKPKQILSGDFIYYRYIPRESRVLTGVADCTGHGVPAALLSVLAHETLNSAVDESSDLAEILRLFNNKLVSKLSKNSDQFQHDTVDLAIADIDLVNRTVKIGGARRSIGYFDGVEQAFKEIKFHGSSCGSHELSENPFEIHTREFHEKDRIYFFSDGITDQFGGPQDKKLSKHKFFDFLHSISDRSMFEQEMELNYFFYKWKGYQEQTDDVTVFAFSFWR